MPQDTSSHCGKILVYYHTVSNKNRVLLGTYSHDGGCNSCGITSTCDEYSTTSSTNNRTCFNTNIKLLKVRTW
jgi:hypothetical protein